jgi:hypothetical protein
MRGLLAIAALCALVAAACGGEMPAPEAPSETTPASEATSREPAPDVSGQTLDGTVASLAALRGRPVFVNVWSSW